METLVGSLAVVASRERPTLLIAAYQLIVAARKRNMVAGPRQVHRLSKSGARSAREDRNRSSSADPELDQASMSF